LNATKEEIPTSNKMKKRKIYHNKYAAAPTVNNYALTNFSYEIFNGKTD
jgi:hypothetical protein